MTGVWWVGRATVVAWVRPIARVGDWVVRVDQTKMVRVLVRAAQEVEDGRPRQRWQVGDPPIGTS